MGSYLTTFLKKRLAKKKCDIELSAQVTHKLIHKQYGLIAQRLERRLCKAEASGSNRQARCWAVMEVPMSPSHNH